MGQGADSACGGRTQGQFSVAEAIAGPSLRRPTTNAKAILDKPRMNNISQHSLPYTIGGIRLNHVRAIHCTIHTVEHEPQYLLAILCCISRAPSCVMCMSLARACHVSQS